MKIKFLGAAGTVTGSSYLVTALAGQTVLVDLGLYQGPKEIEELNRIPLDVDCQTLAGVVLTHAHLDHCGRIPILERLGYRGNIYMTAPTAELTEISLFDSAKIGLEDHPNEALYDETLVEQVVKRFVTVNYDKPFEIGPFKITFLDAGHIIGSASVVIEADGKTMVISGDLGNSPQGLIEPTKIAKNADTVVMESTYGDRLHPDDKPAEIIRSEIQMVEKSGGTLLIPAFSIERTQELLHIISHLKLKGLVDKETAVYLDSPMAIKVTNVYEKYKTFLNEEVENDFRTADPFSFPGLEIVRKREDSVKIHENNNAKVIIAGSGMMTGGRVVEHARRLLPSPTTRLLIVGYQGEGTLGRKILDGETNIVAGKQNIHINATVTDTQAMSSHADQEQLVKWLSVINGVSKVILSHGEDAPRATLADKIKAELHISNILIPARNEEIEV